MTFESTHDNITKENIIYSYIKLYKSVYFPTVEVYFIHLELGPAGAIPTPMRIKIIGF